MADADFSVKAIISAQTSQFEKGIKNAQSSINSLSSSISNITNLVKKAFAFTGVAIGTKAIVDFGKSCVQSANEAVKTFNILDNTVKATGADAWTSTKELEKASMELSDSTNYSVTEIQQMQSVLLGFTNITGEAFDGASEAVLDMATVMGMDLTSAVQTIGKALDDPITGLDSLRRQGFKFTDEQKAELAQLVKNGKQLEAQKIILDTLAISYGGASKAGQDSFAKQRHAVENLSDSLGTKLIPVMQVFAENNAKMINSLRELIENTDFTPVINVVTNLKKIFAEAFNTVSGYLRNVGDYVSDFISRFNFKPIISVLDTLIGVLAGVISKFKEINSQKLEIFDKLKEALIDFSNSKTFQNIVDFVNKIIDAVFFLWAEIQDIGTEIRDLIINKIIEIWGKIKELFQNGQNALSASGQDIASWGDLFYDVLNNTFRSFQDLFGMIKALIHGDWAVAWEYAKLTVMRIADNILDIFSTIANAFPDLVNVFLKGWNWIIEQINKARKLFGQDPLDLAGAFESVDLSKKSGLEDKIKETENKIQELTGKAADITIQNLEGVSTKFAGFTQHALGEIGKLTEGVATNSEKQKQYFTGTFSSTEGNGKSTYEKFSEWDSKLLQQRLEDLKEWSNKYHEVNLQLIEEERKKALEADKTGAETEKINAYYNKQIEKENKRFVKTIAKQTLTIASTTIQVFKKVASTIKNIFSTAVGLFSKVFDFNPNDVLDKLLEVEDSVLTFFVETLPQLPALVESIIQSIAVLVENLFNTVDGDQLVKVLDTIVSNVLNTLPDIISKIASVGVEIITSLANSLTKNLPTIFTALTKMMKDIMPKLSEILTSLVEFLGTLLQEGIPFIVQTLFKVMGELLKQLPSILRVIIEALPILITSILEAIPKFFEEDFPTIIAEFIKLIPTLVKVMVQITVELIKHLPEIVVSIIAGLIKAFAETNWLQIIKDIFTAFIDGIKNFFGIHSPSTVFADLGGNMIKGLWEGMKNLGGWLWDNMKNLFTGIIDGVKGLFSGVGSWLKDTFSNAWEGIKGAWGNAKSFFGDVASGVKNAFSNISQASSSAWDKLKDVTSTVVSKTTSVVSNVVDKTKSVASSVASGVKNALSKLKFWASGTNSAPRGLAVVGEAGPELVRFRGGEQVLNANNTQKALSGMGGTTINQNVTFNNLQDTTAYAMMNQFKQYNRQMAINSII